MGKNINLNSGEWCDIVFEGKNKNYGAYRLRQSSSKRHIAAFIVMFLIAAGIAVLPTLIGVVQNLARGENLGNIDEARELTNIPIEEQVPEENIIKQEVAPPPPPLKSSVKFTPPVIKEDDQVKDEDLMKSQDDLSKTKVTISIADVKGTNDKTGIDIADLERHKVIVEERPVDKPYDSVEVMPTFPGGDDKMREYLKGNVNYPSVALENGISGRTLIRFVVTRTGEISDVRVLRGFNKACDDEAVRVIKSMPKWIPGKQNGINVPVYFNVPVTFRVTQ